MGSNDMWAGGSRWLVALGGLALSCAGASIDDSDPSPLGPLPASTGSAGQTGGSSSDSATGPDSGSATSGGSGPQSTTGQETTGQETGADCAGDADCEAPDACTEARCVDETCTVEDIVCDDGIDCTFDDCDPSDGCIATPDDSSCGDDDACNGTDVCDTTLGCRPDAEAVVCEDSEACTQNVCDSVSGDCSYPTIDTCTNADGCCVSGCSVQQDDDCVCTNLAPTATATSSGGGSNGTGFGPANWIDGVDQAGCIAAGCNQCYGWITNSSSPSGAYMQLMWPAEVSIGSMVLDANDPAAGCLSSLDRRAYGGRVQSFNGAAWVDVDSWTGGPGNVIFDFDPPLSTTGLRLIDVVTAPGGSNTLAFEWYVYSPLGCMP